VRRSKGRRDIVRADLAARHRTHEQIVAPHRKSIAGVTLIPDGAIGTPVLNGCSSPINSVSFVMTPRRSSCRM
jgi:hypothetical protein